jgi:hypothetical protein
MMNGIRRAQIREEPASDSLTCAMMFIVVDVVRQVVEGKEATEGFTSKAVQTRRPLFMSTIIHNTPRSSSLALYQLYTAEPAPLIQT